MLEFTRHGVDCAFRCCLAGPIGSTRPNGATSAGPTAKQSELWEVLTALAAKATQRCRKMQKDRSSDAKMIGD